MRALAQKTGVVRGERVNQADQLFARPVRHHVPVVLRERLESLLAQLLPQPRRHQRLLAALQIQSEALVRQFTDLAKLFGSQL